MEEDIKRKKEIYDREVSIYNGDDPLKLHFDYLLWLDQKYGKDNIMPIFRPVLENVLQLFWNVKKYEQDIRYFQLLLIYSNIHNDPSVFLNAIYDKGIGRRNHLLYKSWAHHLVTKGDLSEAYKVFNLGVTNCSDADLKKGYNDFLKAVGKKYLKGELGALCSKCSAQIKPTVQVQEEPDQVVCWEMNPQKPGEKDDFDCTVAYFEPEEDDKKPMYPKHLVYVNGKEFSLEEIRARDYYDEMNKQTSSKAPVEIKPKTPISSKNATLQSQEDPSMCLSTTQQSYTVHTKEAMNFIQQMWNSPVTDGFKSSLKPKAEKTPFVYCDDSNLENVPFKTPFIEPENGAQVKTSQRRAGPLSERKSQPDINLNHGCTKKLFEQDIEVLAQKLSDTDIKDLNKQSLKPLIENQDKVEYMADETCNTQAFAFALPSSTPIQNRKAPSIASFAEDTKPSQPTNLSIIFEASKERCSSSISSNGNPSNHEKAHYLDDVKLDDPFDAKLIDHLLNHVGFPLPYQNETYYVYNENLPKFGKNVKLDEENFAVNGEIGKGAYARVFKATSNETICAMKVEKPPCKWEYYIAKEIQKRVEPNMKSSFLDIRNAYIFNNGSILETEWAKYGTLLSIINTVKAKTGKMLDNGIAIHFALEMVNIIDCLHKVKIIHGDVKPDNFVVRALPTARETRTCIQLIDFGRCIDMTLFPKDTNFKKVVVTDGFQCNEMKENKPWTYQTDHYGLAGTIHCILVSEYMQVCKKKNSDVWSLQKSLPRNANRPLWDPIFNQLLNIKSCDEQPDLSAIVASLTNALRSISESTLITSFKHLATVMNSK